MRYVPTALAGIALAALAPTAAHAAGFTTPRLISTPMKDGGVDTPLTAVAPNGRTAVAWRTFGRHNRDFQYYAALGSTPSTLGKAVRLAVGRGAANDVGPAFLLARPDGGIVACFSNEPQTGNVVEACSIAPPTGGFGAAHVIRRANAKLGPAFEGAMQADGRVVFGLGSDPGKHTRILQSATMDTAGNVSSPQFVDRIDATSLWSIASAADGTVGLTYAVSGATKSAPLESRLRTFAEGASAFGPNIAVLPSLDLNRTVPVVHGGRDLVIEYEVGVYGADDYHQNLLHRRPDGTFDPVFALPSPVKGGGYSSGVTQLADGTPLAITNAIERSNDDCSGPIAGTVTALEPPAAGGAPASATLSNPAQIALEPTAAGLADGTAIVVWHDSFGELGSSRLELAIRPAGAASFAAPQVLPMTSTRDISLAAGGNQAVLAWTTGVDRYFGGAARLVVSSLATAPPYASPVARPKHPQGPCE